MVVVVVVVVVVKRDADVAAAVDENCLRARVHSGCASLQPPRRSNGWSQDDNRRGVHIHNALGFAPTTVMDQARGSIRER